MKKVITKKTPATKRSPLVKALEEANRAQVRLELNLPSLMVEVLNLQKKLEHLHTSTTRMRIAAIGTNRLRRHLEDLEIEEEWFYGAMSRTLQMMDLYCQTNGLQINQGEEKKGGEE